MRVSKPSDQETEIKTRIVFRHVQECYWSRYPVWTSLRSIRVAYCTFFRILSQLLLSVYTFTAAGSGDQTRECCGSHACICTQVSSIVDAISCAADTGSGENRKWSMVWGQHSNDRPIMKRLSPRPHRTSASSWVPRSRSSCGDFAVRAINRWFHGSHTVLYHTAGSKNTSVLRCICLPALVSEGQYQINTHCCVNLTSRVLFPQNPDAGKVSRFTWQLKQ